MPSFSQPEVMHLIATAPGQRPLRTVVGAANFGAAAVNERTADLAKPMLDALGLGHLATVATERVTAAG